MSADFEAVGGQLRRHGDVVASSVTGLENAALVLVRVTTASSPYGLLLADMPVMYQKQHDRQIELTDYLAHNLKLLSTRLDVAASAYCSGDPVRAEQAVINGRGVPSFRERRTVMTGFPIDLAQQGPGTALVVSSGPEPPLVPEAFVRAFLTEPDRLIGSIAAVSDIAAVWREISQSHHRLADRLAGSAASRLDSWTGGAAVEHGRLLEHNINAIRGLADIAKAMAHSMNACVAVMSLARRRLTELIADRDLLSSGGGAWGVPVAARAARHAAFQGLVAAILIALRHRMTG